MGNYFGSRLFTELQESEEFQRWQELPNTPRFRENPTWDPRSPSTEISRTPIQLPDLLDAPIEDPRSPTVGIARTPILKGTTDEEEEELNISEVEETNSRESGEDVSLLGLEELKFSETEDTSQVEPEYLHLPEERATPTPPGSTCSDEDVSTATGQGDPSLSSVTREELPAGNLPALPRTVLQGEVDAESWVSCLKKSEIQVQTNPKSSKIPLKKQTPRNLFRIYSDDEGVETPSKLSPGRSSRSPITSRNMNIDVNSPREIVQRKQVNKMLRGQGDVKVMHGSPQKPLALNHVDKENQ